MKYDPKLECEVLLAIQERGEATTEELLNFLTEQQKVDIDQKTLIRYLRRWKAKKVVAGNYHDGQVVWKIADIPPWYISGVMTIVKGTVDTDMRTELDALNDRLKSQGRIVQPRSMWGDYHMVEATFETVDPILGGRLSGKDGELVLPKTKDGKRFIPSSWPRAWIGSNAALQDLPHSIKYHLAVMNVELPEFEPEYHRLKVKTGLARYEAIPAGTQFTVKMGLPFKGSKLKTLEDWQKFFNLISEIPLRGLGANPFALGGRVKLVEMKQIA